MSSSSLNTVSFEVLESVKFDLNDKYKATCKLFYLIEIIYFFLSIYFSQIQNWT